MQDDRCSVCNNSFRGHDPLTDGKGRYFHKKCAPKPDRKGVEASIKKFCAQYGVQEIQIGKKVLRTDR